jgi:hypothetical protein
MSTRGRRRNGEQKFSERLTIMVSPDLRQALEVKAVEDDRSIGEIARRVLVERLLSRPTEEKVG